MKAAAGQPLLQQDRKPLSQPLLMRNQSAAQAVFEECEIAEGENVSWRRHVWRMLNPTPNSPKWIRRYEFLSAFFTLLIILQDVHRHVDAVTNETMASFSTWPRMLVIDGPAVLFFGLEYLGRVWSCPESKKAMPGRHDCTLRFHYIFSFMPIVDLLVLIALCADIGTAFASGHVRDEGQAFLRAFRMLRMFRVIMLFKFGGSTDALLVVFAVITRKKNELAAALLTAVMLMFISAIAMYHLEKDAAPDDGSGITDISGAMWWAAAALTTVGYGDVTPRTLPGRSLGVLIAFFGIGIFGLPAGIVSAGFAEEIAKTKADSEWEVENNVIGEVRSLTGKVEHLTAAVEKMQRDQDRMLAMQQQILEALKK